MDVVDRVIARVPECHPLLYELDNLIARGRTEIAKLAGNEPPTRSLKTTGSIESLRPNGINEPDNINNINAPRDAPQAPGLGTPTSTGRITLQRRPSEQISGLNEPSKNDSTTICRGRKTEPIILGETQASKPLNSLIYYDPEVQAIFKRLIRLISPEASELRKTKTTIRMVDMKRNAEVEAALNEDEIMGSGNILNGNANVNRPTITTDKTGMEGDSEEYKSANVPFGSLKRMEPSASEAAQRMKLPGDRGSPNRKETGSSSNAFDDLITSMERFLNLCIEAASQVLRDGTCTAERIEIKNQLRAVEYAAKQTKAKLSAE
jgi:hypothetical protein